MKRCFHFLLPFTAGLFLSQGISSWVVYQSNLQYHRILGAVHDSGYLTVPNLYVMQRLKDYLPAVSGGLFFTLTFGLFLTMLTMATAWSWSCFWNRRKTFLLFPLFLLGAGIWASNRQGFSLLPALHLLLLPPVVFLLSGKLTTGKNRGQSNRKSAFTRFLLFALFILSVAYQTNTNVFLTIRDNFLFSSAFGRHLNQFYYDNSLYAARVFKSGEQRLFNACSLAGEKNSPFWEKVKNQLLRNDYLPIQNSAATDIDVRLAGQHIQFGKNGKWLFTDTIEHFLQHSDKTVARVGKMMDRHSFLRQMTMLSILVVGAAILYGILFLPVYVAVRRYCIDSIAASITAGLLCIVLGTTVTYLLASDPHVSERSLDDYLNSPQNRQRVRALKVIYNRRIPITKYSGYQHLMQSDNVAERYWLAKALGVARSRETHEALLSLLDDPHFNVACMALFSLGQQSYIGDIPLIIKKIDRSRNWYEQWYAYKALRKIGWRQNP